jgi:surface carbohydrate biosynthesis protein
MKPLELYLSLKAIKYNTLLPGKKSLLIYDRLSERHLSKYFNSIGYEVLDIRKESLNIPIFTISLMKYLFNKISISKTYCIEYIKYVNPRVVITNIDNNKNFWTYKGIFNDMTFIFVQNGTRGVIGDVFDLLINAEDQKQKKYFVDYMFVFGGTTENLYRKYIDGRIYRIGSFINNMNHPIGDCTRDVVYVLQFKVTGRDKDYRYKTSDGRKITWDDCYSYNDKIIKYLRDYCVNNNMTLSILGRSKIISEQVEEEKYINNIIPENCYEYIPSKQQYTSYYELLRTKIIVVMESTLGYEMLARRKRVIYLGVREETLGESSRFGWPDLPKRGFFWTNKFKRSEFDRVTSNVVDATDAKWNEICDRYVNAIIEYDPGNGKFLSIMRKLNVDLKHDSL